MKNIVIDVSRETSMVNLSKTTIGNDGENLQGKLIFKFTDEFVNGQARLEYENATGSNYFVLEKVDESYQIPIKNVITKEGNIQMQLVITENDEQGSVPVFKSNIFYLRCNASINAVTEAPDGYELWIERANAILNEMNNIDIDISSEGEDTKVIITRKDGTTKEATVSGGSGSSLPPYPTFDSTKQFVLMLMSNQENTGYELKWVEVQTSESNKLITSDNFIFKTANGEEFILKGEM